MNNVYSSNAWILSSPPTPHIRMRLFCFPSAGSGAAMYRFWSDDLPAQIEVCRIQAPGRENRLREPPFTRLDPLVHRLVSILHPHLDLPFAFFGHSLGALVSFELARQLRKQYGLSPVQLFVSACRAPQHVAPEAAIHDWPEAAFVAEMCRRYQGIPKAVLHHAELMELLLPTLRADMAVFETYLYTDDAPLDCPIAVFGGIQDSWVDQAALAAWRHQTRRAFTLRMFPGDHFFLQHAHTPLLRAMVEELNRTT